MVPVIHQDPGWDHLRSDKRKKADERQMGRMQILCAVRTHPYLFSPWEMHAIAIKDITTSAVCLWWDGGWERGGCCVKWGVTARLVNSELAQRFVTLTL